MYLQRNTEALSCNHCCSGKNQYDYISWVCICSLRYETRNSHEPYCNLWPARLYIIFPNYHI